MAFRLGKPFAKIQALVFALLLTLTVCVGLVSSAQRYLVWDKYNCTTEFCEGRDQSNWSLRIYVWREGEASPFGYVDIPDINQTEIMVRKSTFPMLNYDTQYYFTITAITDDNIESLHSVEKPGFRTPKKIQPFTLEKEKH